MSRPGEPRPALDRFALARTIDHTLLAADATAAAIDTLCADALRHSFANVCVHGAWVRRCAEILRDSRVGVAAVVGFPLGAMATAAKVAEAEAAIGDGAREIDTVLFLGALKSGADDAAYADASRVTAVCHERGARVKVILETCLLAGDEIARACGIAERAGADFVKTSTGFSRHGATVQEVEALHRLVGGRLGIKASGGIRDLATALAMLGAGATRLGTSSSVAIVSELEA
jgi:deoxyribose-phosphate aldolase